MPTRLVTFLGTGDYKPTNYELRGQSLTTCYVAHALATFLQADELIVLATQDAWDKNAAPLMEALASSQLPEPKHVPIGTGPEPSEL